MKTEKELLHEANELLRAFVSIADRRGKATNWEALSNRLSKVLKEQHNFLYPHDSFHVPAPRRPSQLKPKHVSSVSESNYVSEAVSSAVAIVSATMSASAVVSSAMSGHVSSVSPNPTTEPTMPERITSVTSESHLTTDPKDPELGHGIDTERVPQNKKYLVLSNEERAKGFVRPLRHKYVHVGRKVLGTMKPLTEEQRERYAGEDYAMFEDYEGKRGAAIGRYWTRRELDTKKTIDGVTYVGGCGALTIMSHAISETYARDPKFYGATYCVGCGMHLPVGEEGEFIWDDGSNEMVGT